VTTVWGGHFRRRCSASVLEEGASGILRQVCQQSCWPPQQPTQTKASEPPFRSTSRHEPFSPSFPLALETMPRPAGRAALLVTCEQRAKRTLYHYCQSLWKNRSLSAHETTCLENALARPTQAASARYGRTAPIPPRSHPARPSPELGASLRRTRAPTRPAKPARGPPPDLRPRRPQARRTARESCSPILSTQRAAVQQWSSLRRELQ
jgi:hypothetical protein